jgi:hypothetical protein
MSLESGSLNHWLIKELLALEWNITCMDARSIAEVYQESIELGILLSA